MPRHNASMICTSLVLLIAPPASGYWGGGCDAQVCDQCGRGNSVIADCYRKLEKEREANNLWPQQYLELDRQRAKAPFDTMVSNGWRRQNLIGAHHFNDDSTELTRSGKLRIQWALTQAPENYRQVYVERSLKQGMNERRMQVVKNFATEVIGDRGAELVNDTHITSDGRPAPVVDYVNTAFQENMMVPKLPESSFEGLDSE